MVMAEVKAPTKGTTRGGGSPNQRTEGCNKRRRRRLRGGWRPSGNTTTNKTRGVPWHNKRWRRQAKAQLEGEGGQCAGQHDNQPNKGGAMVQQEAAAPGRGATRRGGRPGYRSMQHDNQPNYIGVTRSGGVMRGGARPRRRAMQSNAKQHANQQRAKGRGAALEAEGGHQAT
jgi:hypothetical protein